MNNNIRQVSVIAFAAAALTLTAGCGAPASISEPLPQPEETSQPGTPNDKGVPNGGYGRPGSGPEGWS